MTFHNVTAISGFRPELMVLFLAGFSFNIARMGSEKHIMHDEK